MIPRLHPPETRLLDHVVGAGDPAARALVECHLALCDACAARVQDLSLAGGAFMAQQAPLPVSPDLFGRILDRIAQEPPPVAAAPALRPFQDVLAPYLPPNLARGWRGALAPGFRFLELAAELPRGVKLYLIHMAAGKPFPEHQHLGLEEAVILAGGLADETGRYEAGDWDAKEEGSHHTPRALADEDCWLVARMEAEIRFTGWRGLLQRLA
jgi:putative transcriptional regulator